MGVDKQEVNSNEGLTPLQICRQTAMNYIGLGGKSSGRVRDKLTEQADRAGYTPDDIEITIDRLVSDGYINDALIARRVVRERRGRRAESPLAITQRILGLGVDEAIAYQVVQDEARSQDELCTEWLEAHGGRELQQMADLMPYEASYQKLLGRLGRRAQSRGFSADAYMRTVQMLLDEYRNHVDLD